MSYLFAVTIGAWCLIIGSLIRRYPKFGFIFWIVTVSVIPPWIFLTLGGARIAPAAVSSIVVIGASIGLARIKWNATDVALTFLIATVLCSSFLSSTPLYFAVQAVGEWMLCYFAARILIERQGMSVATMGVVAAALAIISMIQYFTGFNFGELIRVPGLVTGHDFWQELQFRDGLVRGEATFGHSIALGGSLSLMLPFLLRLRPRLVGLLLSATVLGGIVATQSRGAMLSAVLVIGISVIVDPRIKKLLKIATLLPAVFIFFVIGPDLIAQIILGGSDMTSEVVQGTMYRIDALTLISEVNWLGLAEGSSFDSSTNSYSWDKFRSIDNAILYIALYSGGLAALSFIGAYLVQFITAMRNAWTPGKIAIVAHLPLLLTVAPITQYQSIYWFVMGIAAVNLNRTSINHTNRRFEGFSASLNVKRPN